MRARTLSRRGQPVPGWRIGLFALGIALLVVAVASPVARIGEEELFAFHMAQHLLLGDLAPLCLLAGLTGPVLRPAARASGRDATTRAREPVRRAPAVDREPRALAHPGGLRGRGRERRAPCARAHRVLHRGHRALAPGPRDAPGARVVRVGSEARLHRRRPPRGDGARECLRLGGRAVLRRLRRAAATISASRRRPTSRSRAR